MVRPRDEKKKNHLWLLTPLWSSENQCAGGVVNATFWWMIYTISQTKKVLESSRQLFLPASLKAYAFVARTPQYVRPEYVCHKLRLTGQSWDSALALQRGIIVRREKAKSSASGLRRERARALSLSPSVAAGARPASADRLVPARSPRWLLTLPQPRNRWGEESERRRGRGNSSLFRAWHRRWVWVFTVGLLYTQHNCVV